jgi:hypothetical protein
VLSGDTMLSPGGSLRATANQKTTEDLTTAEQLSCLLQLLSKCQNQLALPQVSNIYDPPTGTSPCGSWYGVWSHYTGQDFGKDHSMPTIDFAAFHMWPDNWVSATLDFARNWIDIHAK